MTREQSVALPQLKWTPDIIEKLRTEAWEAVSNREHSAIKIELLLSQIEEVLERKLVSGNEVLVWHERRIELQELHQLATSHWEN